MNYCTPPRFYISATLPLLRAPSHNGLIGLAHTCLTIKRTWNGTEVARCARNSLETTAAAATRVNVTIKSNYFQIKPLQKYIFPQRDSRSAVGALSVPLRFSPINAVSPCCVACATSHSKRRLAFLASGIDFGYPRHRKREWFRSRQVFVTLSCRIDKF